jgi:hypothetical protein
MPFSYYLLTAALSVLPDIDAISFSPFHDQRYFFPWQPIHVSPIGLAVFGRQGLRALASEVVWVWIPLAAGVGLFATARRFSY